jgi:hypothetical protein
VAQCDQQVGKETYCCHRQGAKSNLGRALDHLEHEEIAGVIQKHVYQPFTFTRKSKRKNPTDKSNAGVNK